MLKSMTGYGAAFSEHEKYVIKAEIKTLNSKTFDFKCRLPQKYFAKEIEIQSFAEKMLIRGKTDLNLQIKYKGTENNKKVFQAELIDTYFQEIFNFFEKWQQPKEQAAQIVFNMPDILTTDITESNIDEEEWNDVLNCLTAAMNNLNDFRQTEGSKLENQIVLFTNNLLGLKRKIENLAGKRIESINEKIRQKLAESELEFNKDRLEQEMIYYLEKIDIKEELDRLGAHLSYFKHVIETEKYSGRKLSFISQEIGREINTIGSKANDYEIQKIVVEMKEELEKIKQQLANIL